MKKIAVLLALVLCLMMATTAMAATPFTVSETTVPAKGSNGKEYMLNISPYETEYPLFYTADFMNGIKAHIEEAFRSEEYRYMYFDASVDGEDAFQGNNYLTREFDADFFGEKGIEKFMAFYYSGDEGLSGEYEPDRLEDYTTEVIGGKKKVKVVIDHLTPVVFAWIPGEPAPDPVVAAPLQAPDMPSTGDSSSLPGMFILLGMSMAAFAAMKLCRREN